MLSSQNAGTGVYFLVYGADDLTAGRLKDFCKSATAVPFFLLLLQKKTSPGGFRFPSGAPLNQPRKPLRFSWIFPAIFETAQIFWRYTYKLRRGRCRSQPFAAKERYGCGSAACRYTSTRQFAPVFYKTVRQICSCPMGRQSRRPLQQVSALPVGADDSVRPQNMSILRKFSANSLLPSGPMWASASTTKYADAYEFAVDFR